MFQAMLIKFALDAVMNFAVEAATEKVNDRKSKIAKPFLDTFVHEQDALKTAILELAKKKK